MGGVIKQLVNMSDFFLWTTNDAAFWKVAKKWLVWYIRPQIVRDEYAHTTNYGYLKMLSYAMNQHLQRR